MTKTEQIRKLAEFKPSEVAAIIGCSAEYVSVIRCKEKKPDLYRRIGADACRRWRARNPDKALANGRANYHRNKKLGGIGHPRWTEDHTMLLVLLLESGKSFGQIAKEMNISRSTVSGRVKRLRDAGVIA